MSTEQKVKVVRAVVWMVIVVQILFLGYTAANAQNPADILDKAARTYESANGMQANFTLHTRSPQQGYAESFDGTIDMKGDKFTLKTPDMQVWYDGKTMWTYVDRTEEVNITTPTGEELQFTNPAILLGSYRSGFTPVYKGESTSANSKAAYDIELIPRKKGDVQKVELQVEKISGLPSKITVSMKNEVSSTIHIGQLKTNVSQPDSYFVFNKADFPGVEIVDLR
ncbi:MAG: outer-membrane lipoprotein carrier protein LolA [Tannerellaceae bacterium]|nr:outer-membrane lipoprotein carrier protein LolA [Tannerellaceae bacterium]